MSFHVQVGRSFRKARVFNLDDAQLRATILEPWSRGRPIEVGEREWDSRESDLTVLEGPALDPAELAHGQGWNRAVKSSRDVTAALLAPAVAGVAVLAPEGPVAATLRSVVEEAGLAPVEWSSLRARILASHEAPGVAAALVAADGESAFDAGLALGAFGARAIVVQAGAGPLGPALAGVPVIRLDDGPPALEAIAERLRRAVAG